MEYLKKQRYGHIKQFPFHNDEVEMQMEVIHTVTSKVIFENNL